MSVNRDWKHTTLCSNRLLCLMGPVVSIDGSATNMEKCFTESLPIVIVVKRQIKCLKSYMTFLYIHTNPQLT